MTGILRGGTTQGVSVIYTYMVANSNREPWQPHKSLIKSHSPNPTHEPPVHPFLGWRPSRPSLKTCVKVATNVNHHQKRIPLQHPQWSYPNHRNHLLPIHSGLDERSPRIWPSKTHGKVPKCQENNIKFSTRKDLFKKKNAPFRSLIVH